MCALIVPPEGYFLLPGSPVSDGPMMNARIHNWGCQSVWVARTYDPAGSGAGALFG